MDALRMLAFFLAVTAATALAEWKSFQDGKVQSPAPAKRQNHQREKVHPPSHAESIEKQMHLRPLNERHHKFPNPNLLSGKKGTPKIISRHGLLKLNKMLMTTPATNTKTLSRMNLLDDQEGITTKDRKRKFFQKKL